MTNASTNTAPGHQLAAALARQQAAFRADPHPAAALRVDRLQRAIDLLLSNQLELAAAMAEDFGQRPVPLSRFVDIAVPVKALKYARDHVRHWMRPERRPASFPFGLLGGKASVHFQPKGVVGIISPWNFPINLSFGPLASALAAGNRAMLKPSEFTPATSALLEQLISQAFDADEVAVFRGGAAVGAAFASQPFDHLMFTGSTLIGSKVMAAAANNLTPVTLELGGKSPVLVADDAGLEQAARRIINGKMMNAGQVCLAPDYVLVTRDRLQPLVAALKQAALAMFPELPTSDDHTAIIDQKQMDRVQYFLDDAHQRGLALEVIGGPANKDRLLPLTLIVNPAADAEVLCSELFAPILPILPVDSMDEAMAYVNQRPRPLALYLFTDDKKLQRRVLYGTHSGGVTINDVIMHFAQEELPFGGIGPSGMGSYHGFEGFRTFSHAKAVYRQTSLPIAKWLGLQPPYGKQLERVLKFELRR